MTKCAAALDACAEGDAFHARAFAHGHFFLDQYAANEAMRVHLCAANASKAPEFLQWPKHFIAAREAAKSEGVLRAWAASTDPSLQLAAAGKAPGEAVQVEHIRVDPGLKALGCQPVESTSLSKVLVSDLSTCTPTSWRSWSPRRTHRRTTG